MRPKTISKAAALLLILTTNLLVAQNIEASLSSLFDTLNTRRNFDGCVLVARNGKILLEKAYGFADEESARPLNLETVFELASVSKQFTAMAVMQLKAKGALAYSDPIQKFLPSLPYQEVTVRDLLVHTAGIPDFMGWGEDDLDVSRVNRNEDILKRLPAKYYNVDFQAGSRFGYSNTNYLLLACIVEKLSGLPFAEYLEKNVFIPAGMRDTRVYSRHSQTQKIENYAYGYLWNPTEQKFVNMDVATTYAFHMDGIAGPYGISSNIHDLYRWDQALYSEKLLSHADLFEAFQPSFLKNRKEVVKTSEGMISGFGWRILPYPSPNQIEMFHSGGYGGYSNLIVRNTGKKETVILLSNHKEMADVYSIMNAIDEILKGEPVTIPDRVIPKKAIFISASKLPEFGGDYAPPGKSSYKFRVRYKGNQLYVKPQDQIEEPVYAEAVDTFFYSAVNAKIKFSRDQNGKVDRLSFMFNNEETSMLRVE